MNEQKNKHSKNNFSLHKYLVKNLSKFGSLPPSKKKKKFV